MNSVCLEAVPYGLTLDSFPDLRLPDDEELNVYLVNKSNLTWEGFSVLTADKETPWGIIPKEDIIHNSRLRTLEVIAHRDKVLTSLGLTLPYDENNRVSERYLLKALYEDLVISNGGNADYKQYYFPQVSYVAHYQPSVKEGEILSDKFKAGMWFCETNKLFWLIGENKTLCSHPGLKISTGRISDTHGVKEQNESACFRIYEGYSNQAKKFLKHA